MFPTSQGKGGRNDYICPGPGVGLGRDPSALYPLSLKLPEYPPPPIKQLLFPESGRRSWETQESPYASPQTQAAHLPWPNPELSPCFPFTYTSSSAWLILSRPGISDPFPLWLGLLPPVLLRLPKTGLKMKGWAEVVAPPACEETIPSVLTQRAPRSSRDSKSQYTFS